MASSGPFGRAPPPSKAKKPCMHTPTDDRQGHDGAPKTTALAGGSSAFRKVPRTGVIYVMGEAARHGYKPSDDGEDAWCNLGQGQPETGPLPGSPPRCSAVEIAVDDQEYAPVA